PSRDQSGGSGFSGEGLLHAALRPLNGQARIEEHLNRLAEVLFCFRIASSEITDHREIASSTGGSGEQDLAKSVRASAEVFDAILGQVPLSN
ncbi:hypothetical protein C1X59_30105, partial [Pseudomonas sp. FW215-R2]